MTSERSLSFPAWSSAPRVESLWLQQALADESGAQPPTESLGGLQRADVCIIGGGFTGLWTALRLKELDPSQEVAIVEAGLCGSGASGRNGGIVVGWWSKLPTLIKLCGREEARRLLDASLQGIDDVEALCRDHALGASFRRAGWLWTATNSAQLDAWDGTFEAIKSLGLLAWQRLGKDELAQRLGSPWQLGGVIDETAGVVQPAALARALLAVVRAAGVRVFEHSPVRSVQTGTEVSIRGESGVVRAGRVVLAMNAWMAHLDEFRRHVFIVSSDMIATEPIGEQLVELGWTGGESWSDSGAATRYARTTSDGRIALGRGGGTLAFRSRVGDQFDRSARQVRRLTEDFRRLFPTVSARLTHGWAGAVERSAAGIPAFGRLRDDPRLVYGIGYSGTGVAPCAAGGRIIASLVLERDDEHASIGATLCRAQAAASLPPEPVRYLGGRVVQAAVARKERAEDKERIARRVDRSLAKLIPNPVE